MNGGMNEATMREAFLRSPEFAAKNPDPDVASRLGLNVHIPSGAILADVSDNLGMRWVRTGRSGGTHETPDSRDWVLHLAR